MIGHLYLASPRALIQYYSQIESLSIAFFVVQPGQNSAGFHFGRWTVPSGSKR